jgi:hypothetical protein
LKFQTWTDRSFFNLCYTAPHGNKETLKLSHFNSQETRGASFTDKESGFITYKESGDEGHQISGQI